MLKLHFCANKLSGSILGTYCKEIHTTLRVSKSWSESRVLLFFNPHILNKTLKIQFNRIKHQIYLVLTTRILRKSQMMNYQKVKTEPKAIAGISRSFNPAASVQTCQASLEGRKQNKTQEMHCNQVLIRSCSSCSGKLLNTEIPSQRFAAEAKYEPYKETEVQRHLFCSVLSDAQQ